MAEYIERKKLIEFACRHIDGKVDANDIARFPTTDVVPVVRCNDCKYWWKENELCLHPKCCYGKVAVVFATSTHYCSYGERSSEK